MATRKRKAKSKSRYVKPGSPKDIAWGCGFLTVEFIVLGIVLVLILAGATLLVDGHL